MQKPRAIPGFCVDLISIQSKLKPFRQNRLFELIGIGNRQHTACQGKFLPLACTCEYRWAAPKFALKASLKSILM